MAAVETRTFQAHAPLAVELGVHDPRQARVESTVGWAHLKRGVDMLFALIALLAVAPIMLVLALAVKLDSRGPILFRQRRMGRNLRPFTLLKFRTMHDGVGSDLHRRYIAALMKGQAVESDSGLKKLVDDPRVTRLGRVLRRLSLDELPQLVNVLVGQMSLIGPRPALEYELDHYRPEHYQRFDVRPGLSGLWQVSGRNRISFRQMLDLDVAYTRRCSARTDLRVLLRTPMAVFRGGA